MSADIRKIRPSFVVLALLFAAATVGVVVVACDDTGPSPIGVHFDDAAGDDSGEVDAADAAEASDDDGASDGGDESSDMDATADADADKDADADADTTLP